MKNTLSILILLVSVLLGACGDSGRFAVQGTVEGGRSMNLRYVFYNGDAFMQGITAVRDGRFTFEGTAPQPVMIELYDNDYRLLGRLYAAKGDEIECHIDPASPYRMQASGRKDLERWSSWLRDHAAELATPAVADSLVADYVGRNPADIVSTLLLTTIFDASTPDGLHKADSLLSLIEPEVRPFNLTQSLVAMIEDNIGAAAARVHDFRARILGRGDDTVRIADAPLWLIAVGTEHTHRSDSVLPLLRHADGDYRRSELRVLDISIDMDTVAWRRVTRTDSADWIQAWLPGGTAARGIDSLAVASLPFFIVADSTGRQLLRTPSPTRARAFLSQTLEK